MSLFAKKNWDRHVVHAEEVARGEAFQALRDRILALAEPRRTDTVVDVGAGTGLLTLGLAPRVERVWAVDVSRRMCDYLTAKATSAGLENVEAMVASAVSLPLVDESADLVVSNYCFHHLRDADKRRALAEALRVLRPGGRLVFGDMMFRVSLADRRDRAVIAGKLRRLARKGPSGMLRLLRNALRYATRSWETPARVEWWDGALRSAGFTDVEVTSLAHEGGLATARRPDVASPDRKDLPSRQTLNA